MPDGACQSAGRRAMPRCRAAHRDDASACEGLRDAVRIVDVTGASVTACVRHGAVLLAALFGAGVYPNTGPSGAAIETFRRALALRGGAS